MDVEPDPKQLENYPSGTHDLSVLTMCHVHMVKMLDDEVVRRYTLYLMKIEFICCFNYCKLLLIFSMYYSDFCEDDVNFFISIFAVAWQFKMFKQREEDWGVT